MIFAVTLEKLRRLKPREAVTWFPNQGVAAMDLESRLYFPARQRDTRKRGREVVFHICTRHSEGNNLLQRDKPE